MATTTRRPSPAADPTSNAASLDVVTNVTDVDEPGSVSLNSDQLQVGTELTATLADEDARVSNTTGQWARSADGISNSSDIASATAVSYTPVDADLNHYLRATATYDDTHGTGKSVQAISSNPVQAAPVVNSQPTFDDGDEAPGLSTKTLRKTPTSASPRPATTPTEPTP